MGDRGGPHDGLSDKQGGPSSREPVQITDMYTARDTWQCFFLNTSLYMYVTFSTGKTQ